MSRSRRNPPGYARPRSAEAAPESGDESGHVPVLLEAMLAALQPSDGAVYVDGTFGGGGYSAALLRAAQCRVLGIDRDPAAVQRGAALMAQYPGRLRLIEGRF